MWRADRRHDDPDLSEDLHEPARSELNEPARQVTAPFALSLGDPNYAAINVAEPTWQQWRTELAAVGGRSPLLHFEDGPRTRIELGVTHPGGLATFITGRTTLLSSLIRDDLALRTAKLAASEIAAKGLELATVRGIDSIHLGIGMAQWQFENADYCAPVLLRPLAIRRYGSDFELRLLGNPYLNPELARVLDEQFRIRLDADAFAALAEQDGTFKPNPVIDRLRGLTMHLEWFNVSPRLVVSSFADVGTSMRADAADLEHPVLDALAGNPSAKWAVEESYAPVEVPACDQRAPELDTLLLDADAEQENVVAQINAGNSLVVKTLPGTGGTQTIVNAIGALVAANKRVLVVGPRRSSLTGIAQRLGDVGLAGIAVSPGSLRRDLIRSISRNEKAKPPKLAEVDDALVRLRKVLLDYRVAIARRDPGFGVSVLDCVAELSRLALLPNPPATSARLERSSVVMLSQDRHRAADAMLKAAALGEFRYGPGDSPWYGANFDSSEQAVRAHGIAKQLHHTELPRLLERAGELIDGTRMRPFESIAELGVYLRLLTDIRDTLDKFLPVVFDRSLSDLILATASRKDSAEMSGSNRRRLRRLAGEYVRPGVHVTDLHGALVDIQQRVLWQRFVAAGVTPEVPTGIADVQVAHQQVSQDLAALDEPLDGVGILARLPIPDLQQRLEGLAADSDVLQNLQERAQLRSMLRDLGLEILLADLASRHVPEEQVAAELELAWWRSALESLLESDRALLGANTSVLDRLEADFKLVDEAHAAGSAGLLGWQLAENWKISLVDWPDEAAALKRILRAPKLSTAELQAAAPHLSRTVAPVWLASPYEVHTITDTLRFDTVILVDAGAISLAESVGAIRRGKQTVAFGDPVTQTPSTFEIAISGREDAGDRATTSLDEVHADSVLARLGTLLPTLALTRSYRAGGEDLAELVNRRFYAGKIESFPWAGSFLGHGSIRLDYVEDGFGMPDEESGAVESVDAEVDRVVELVLDHASRRPHESLMVITATEFHAVRVEQAVLAALATRPLLHDFILGDRAEPFTVTTIERSVAQSRDRVIFSIGFGRTPHGRVLSDFGALGKPGGERLLAVAMTCARRAMVIVTCFTPDDLDEDRMHHGALALAGILGDVTARTRAEAVPDDSDPMLVDLARRLESRGLRVALGHRGKLGLVTSFWGKCLTIETDMVLHEMSLRESLRLRPDLLRRLGWHYLRVHAFELFSDPDAVADRVVDLLGARKDPATEPIPVAPGVPS
ncbi:DEAD/DEAH box helicase [Parafrigoribacterium mesophilum]|uniref:DEAD/DEAH box helicase n=1 Tax=Parafrigoribacterium mesophilum TaxID=433646 RepID=UPI003D158C0A